MSQNRPSPRASFSCAVVAVACLALATLAAVGQGPEQDPVTALNEGNRLFRNGQLQEAIETYRSGYSASSPHPTLIYNLGTALHHLDRLPEAILWYRRGGESPDPWLQENLWLARRSLGSQTLPPGGVFGLLTQKSWILKGLAIGLGWLSLAILIALPRFPLWGLLTAAALSAGLYAGALSLERWGPAPAVLLQDCSTPAGDLPAGTEVWVHQAGSAWRLSGSRVSFCPQEHAALVIPNR